jgi:hypothetical protein
VRFCIRWIFKPPARNEYAASLAARLDGDADCETRRQTKGLAAENAPSVPFCRFIVRRYRAVLAVRFDPREPMKRRNHLEKPHATPRSARRRFAR